MTNLSLDIKYNNQKFQTGSNSSQIILLYTLKDEALAKKYRRVDSDFDGAASGGPVVNLAYLGEDQKPSSSNGVEEKQKNENDVKC